jgi:hypothetical protein
VQSGDESNPVRSEYEFSRFVYLDTCIISHLAKNRHLWPRLFEFLKQSDLALGVSGAQLVELSDANHLLPDVAELFISVPSGMLKTWDTILDEEVKAHPQRRIESLLLRPLNVLLLEPNGLQRLQGFLASSGLSDARKDQLIYARQMEERHAILKGNFPPSKTGDYTREQADEFTWIIVIQWLSTTHRDFLAGFKDDIEKFHSEVFLSIRLFAHVVFYKYYLGRRSPKRISDFGDLAHLAPIPYCELAIMERDLCNILNQIKPHQDTLESTVIQNIDFFKGWA